MDQQAAKDHARVVADCFKLSTVLPFRFGTTFQDDDALRRSVRSNQRHFQANVERLRGKAEMHLKVLVDDICPGNSARDMTVGQQYLTSLRESASRQRERQSKARALSIQMHRMFLPLAEEITCKRMDTGKMLLDIAHLIDNKTVERLSEQVHLGDAGAEGLPYAALRTVASVSFCSSHHATASAQRLEEDTDSPSTSMGGGEFFLVLRC